MCFKCKKCQKESNSEYNLKTHDASAHARTKAKCKTCTKVFTKNSDLEVHIEIEHKQAVKLNCNICDMTFALEWRMRKHTIMHSGDRRNSRYCHFFNNEKICPFAKIRFMFMHENAPRCTYMDKCLKTLCPFRHYDEGYISY